MRDMRELRVFCDGAFRQKHVGFGFHVLENDVEIHSESGYRPPKPCNSSPRAEALALYYALDWLEKEGFAGDKIRVFSDSELCIKQLNGDYRINANTSHAEVINAAYELKGKFKNITFTWIPREGNRRADYLSGFLLDQRGIKKI